MSVENLGSIIREAREAKRLTLREAAAITGITFSYIGKLENGKYVPSREKIDTLAKALDLDKNILMLLAGYATDDALKPTDNETKRIPMLHNMKAENLTIKYMNKSYWIVPKEWVEDGEYFFLEVSEDTLVDDGIKEGSRVLVRKQNFVDNGKVGVVVVKGDERVLRRVHYQDGMILLLASNSKIPPILLKPEDVNIKGQVVKVEFDL